jgi:hypothetical protein
LKSPSNQRVEAQQHLEMHQLKMEESNISPHMVEIEKYLHRKLHTACREEEEYWRQNSRNLSRKARDKNTRFFHKQAEARKNYNSVKEIQFQNQTVMDFEGIKKADHLHFKGIYTEDTSIETQHQILNLIPSFVKPRDNQQLTTPVTMEEVKAALDSLAPDKAPGPDGFTTWFLQVC